MSERVVVVGAGLSGLMTAVTLDKHRRSVVVLDKGRSVGGRMATRRLNGRPGEIGVLDHGAQFFTARSPEFVALVEEWMSAGLVREWCRGFGDAADGFPRFCVNGGMNALAKYLARYLAIESNVTVRSIGGFDGVLSVMADDDRRWETSDVVLTAPVPQSLALCENGWLPLPEEDEALLRSVTYVPCFALLVTVDRPVSIAASGARQFGNDGHPVFSFVADNMAKGISAIPAVTFHVNDAVSIERFDDNLNATRAYLLDCATEFLGTATVVTAELKRWKFARPLVGHEAACVRMEPIPGATVTFAGDAFGGAKVEGAVLSGLAAGRALC